MDLSIVIVNWNGGDMLVDCLSSIPTAAREMSVQVIVVDNASRDGSRETAQKKFPAVQVVNSGANLGFAKGNNLARSLVKSDLVLFLNPDTILLPNSLQPMVEFIRSNPEVGAVGCKMRYPTGQVHEQGLQYVPTPWTEFLALLFVSARTRAWLGKWLPVLDPHSNSYVVKLYGGCLLCRRELLDRIGWFDERYFMYAEDVDLCKSIMEQGAKLYYLSNAEIIHIAGGTSRKAPSSFSVLMKADSICKFMEKHHGKVGALTYRLEILGSAIVRGCAASGIHAVAWLAGHSSSSEFKQAVAKHWILMLWALGVKKAFIAT